MTSRPPGGWMRPWVWTSRRKDPSGIKFVENRLWVSDIARDFIGGKGELPDGFIFEIEASEGG